jgi:hypothetical protein
VSGKIKQFNYDANYDEAEQKWYGQVTKSSRVVYKTQYLDSYQAAIQAATRWIADKLNLVKAT